MTWSFACCCRRRACDNMSNQHARFVGAHALFCFGASCCGDFLVIGSVCAVLKLFNDKVSVVFRGRGRAHVGTNGVTGIVADKGTRGS